MAAPVAYPGVAAPVEDRSSVQSGWRRDMHTSRTTRARNFQAEQDRRAFKDRICGLLRAAYADRRDMHKAIARDADCTPRTARNWADGENLPGLWHFLQLARRHPELKAEVARLLELDAGLDPHLERHISDLVTAYQRRKDGA